MDTLQQTTSDGTITFLPHRLNRQPVVVRGLTADELWICTGISASAGLALGLPIAWLASSVAVLPTAIVASIAAGLFIVGGLLRRQKRGRPETWLYRQIQWWFANHLPLLSRQVGAGELITRTGYWAVRRGGA
ncbi:TIGR03750 family conjugal transfer protein [Pseudomonas sp. 91RF]|jgi:conjugative transfer region protein (TIGR03750 family)|uniref:TIGR03750 family conjugal transfer protein n=1 Tax=Pseudomonas sp. 91RF TaxID=2292261 RepID=UPI000E6711C0|nr:TIGR03750 family conjugal transfer protein [Pseudomonas sp. 91RF]RIJ09677.1 TIGR03750 family conjugal transfer protein [Pseudomonas sp. 91RF]